MFLRDEDRYFVAIDVFAQVAETLADAEATLGTPKDLCVVIESCDRDSDEERAHASRLAQRFLELDCPHSARSTLRAQLASCAAGEQPTVRQLDFNVFSLTLDARLGGAQLVDILDDSARGDALFTFGELTELLGH
jgi:hypothetical protein